MAGYTLMPIEELDAGEAPGLEELLDLLAALLRSGGSRSDTSTRIR
ncbi:hypothetical protein [Pyrodictium abyssi]